MTNEEIRKIMDQQERIYNRNYQNFQDSGYSRYASTYRRAEDIMELCRLALYANDDHQRLIDLQSFLVDFGSQAIKLSHSWDEREAHEMIRQLAAASRLRGVEDRWI